MRFKKIVGSLVSAALCLSVLSTNAMALGTSSDLTPVGVQIGETVDITNLFEITDTSVVDSDYDVISLDNLNISSDSNMVELGSLMSPNCDLTDNEYAVSPLASAIPLSSITVREVLLGNSQYGSGTWDPVPFKQSSVQSNYASASIDATGYTHIAVRVLQQGYATGGISTLDGTRETYVKAYAAYNRFGQVADVGDIVYAWEDYYIFKIPTDTRYSTTKFTRYFNQVSPMITKEAQLDINWTTPKGPAPTTPEIVYNVPNSNDDAWISGIDNTMEFRIKMDGDNGRYVYSDWYAITGNGIYAGIAEVPYILQIRYKRSTDGYPSLNYEVPVKTRSEGPISYLEYDSIFEILSVLNSEQQIELAIGDFSSFFAVPPGYYTVEDIIDAIPTGGFDRMYMRWVATADEPASQRVTLTLYGRNPNVPDVHYENGILYDLTPDMIFSFDGVNWYSTQYSAVNITSFMSTTETTLLQIKYMPTENMSCSKIREIILPALQ